MPLINHEDTMSLVTRGRPLALASFADAELTEDMCVAAAAENAFELAAVPDRLMTARVIEAAAKERLDILRYLPADHRTSEKLLPALRGRWDGFLYLREPDWDDALVTEALVRHGWSDLIRSIGQDRVSLAAIVAAARRRPQILDVEVFRKRLTPEAALEILHHDTRDYRYHNAADLVAQIARRDQAAHHVNEVMRRLPERLLTPEFRQRVVEIAPVAVWHLPEDMQTEDHWALAVARPESNTGYHSIPERFKTERVLLALVERNPEEIRSLPDAKRSVAICEAAIRRGPRWITEMPMHLDIDRKLANRAVRKHPAAVVRLHPDAVSEELALFVVGKHPELIDHLPEAARNKAVCDRALDQAPWVLKLVPERLRNKTLCLKMLERANEHTIEGVMQGLPAAHWADPRFVKALNKHEGSAYVRALRYLPPERLTKPMLIRFLREARNEPHSRVTVVLRAFERTPQLFADPAVWTEAARQIADGLDWDLVPDRMLDGFRAAMPEVALVDFAQELKPGLRQAIRLVPEHLLTEGLVAECLAANPDLALDAKRIPLAIRLKLGDQLEHAVERAKCLDLLADIEALGNGRRTKGDLRQAAREIIEASEDLRREAGLNRRVPGPNFPWAKELVKALARRPYEERRQLMAQLIERARDLAPAPAAPVLRRA